MKGKLFSIVLFFAIFSSVYAQGGPWKLKHQMQVGRVGLFACEVDGKIYAIGGGITVDKFVSTVEMYDPVTDTWTTKKSMSKDNALFGAAAVNGKIYAIGGHIGKEGFTDVEMYDPATDLWTQKKSMQHARLALAACAVNGKIYAIGGSPAAATTAIQYVEEYDPATDTWVEKASMPTSRSDHSACVVDGKIYIFGGVSSKQGALQSTVDMYDPATDQWKTCSSNIPTTRLGSSASQVDGKIYVFGGSLSPLYSPFSTVEAYDPVSDKWESKTDMPFARLFHATCSLNGKIYLIGGTTIGVPFEADPTLYEYNPAADITDIRDDLNQIPDKMELLQNYPNPFNPITNIEFRIANSGFVSLRVFDLFGREIASLVNEEKSAGNYKIQFNGSKLSSGVYFYQLRAGDFTSTKQFVLMK